MRIHERIIDAQLLFNQSSGHKAHRLYLGTKEFAELQIFAKAKVFIGTDTERPVFNDLEIFVVNAEKHLGVG